MTPRPPARCWSLMAERQRPALERTGPPRRARSRNRRRARRPRTGDPAHRIQGGHRARLVPQIRIGRVSVTATNGNQEAKSVTETGRGIGVGVMERDHDDDREQGERWDPPGRPITTRQGPNLHRIWPHWRCKQTQGLELRPESHFQSHPLYPISPSISIRSPPNLPLPDAAHWDRREVGERPTARLPFCGPGRRSFVTPAAPGRSPTNLPSWKGIAAPATAADGRRRARSRATHAGDHAGIAAGLLTSPSRALSWCSSSGPPSAVHRVEAGRSPIVPYSG